VGASRKFDFLPSYAFAMSLKRTRDDDSEPRAKRAMLSSLVVDYACFARPDGFCCLVEDGLEHYCPKPLAEAGFTEYRGCISVDDQGNFHACPTFSEAFLRGRPLRREQTAFVAWDATAVRPHPAMWDLFGPED
jgi:hypothetical protein